MNKATQINILWKCKFEHVDFMECYPDIRSCALAGYLMTWEMEEKKYIDLSNFGKQCFDWELKDWKQRQRDINNCIVVGKIISQEAIG